MITVSIELSKVPKEQIVEKNGKKYLNIVVDNRKEPDQYGNTHTVYMSQSKEDRTNKVPKVYIGNGKEYTFGGQPTANISNPNQYNPSPENVDDLPF